MRSAAAAMMCALMVGAIAVAAAAHGAQQQVAGPGTPAASDLSAETTPLAAKEAEHDGAAGNATLVPLVAGVPAMLHYEVTTPGNVSFGVRLRSGAVVEDVFAANIGDCSGPVAGGVHVTGVSVVGGNAHLRDCGPIEQGRHVLGIYSDLSAGIFHVEIDGARWIQ